MKALRRWIAVLLLGLLPSLAISQSNVIDGGIFGDRKASASYTGPGDIVSGADAWYGLRSYSAAYATGSNNAIKVRRASDNTTSNIVILASGALDIATANTFAGTDATCSGTILTTTATLTSCSSTPNAGDTLTGAGLVQPSFVVSCGTFTGGAGTCTLNANQTVSVAETITFQVALFVNEYYDQSGANYCSAAPCHITQGITAQQAELLPNCINNLPCSYSVAADKYSISITSIPAPYSVAGVAERTVNFTTPGNILLSDSPGLFFDAQANTITMSFSVPLVSNASAADSAMHAVNVAYTSGGSGTGRMNVDGVINNSGTGNVGSWVTSLYYGYVLQGYITEAGIWPSTFSSANQTSMCHNQYTYWGTTTSC